ncbi:hypothetical protein F5141DRAFT_1062655 [Pisolithus sp. B1]|nr:hypothetical protein F5141DRAFT_1062655 [Pisolithus sp. B1]
MERRPLDCDHMATWALGTTTIPDGPTGGTALTVIEIERPRSPVTDVESSNDIGCLHGRRRLSGGNEGSNVTAGAKAPSGSSNATLQGVVAKDVGKYILHPSTIPQTDTFAPSNLNFLPCLTHSRIDVRRAAKFANWDPENHLEVGDWGRLTTGRPRWAFWRPKRCVFVKEGNIYKDKIAEKYGIPSPRLLGEENPNGLTWVTSLNARDMDIPTNMGKQTPELADCSVKVGFQFVSGRRDGSSSHDLSRLLGEEALRDCAVVSETHRCASYACYLTSSRTKDIVIGLSSQASENSSSTEVYPKWVRTNRTGYFKGKADNSGERKYYPLYKLVSVRSDGGNTVEDNYCSSIVHTYAILEEVETETPRYKNPLSLEQGVMGTATG